jgi:hypothetical protein
VRRSGEQRCGLTLTKDKRDRLLRMNEARRAQVKGKGAKGESRSVGKMLCTNKPGNDGHTPKVFIWI